MVGAVGSANDEELRGGNDDEEDDSNGGGNKSGVGEDVDDENIKWKSEDEFWDLGDETEEKGIFTGVDGASVF